MQRETGTIEAHLRQRIRVCAVSVVTHCFGVVVFSFFLFRVAIDWPPEGGDALAPLESVVVDVDNDDFPDMITCSSTGVYWFRNELGQREPSPLEEPFTLVCASFVLH